MTRGFALWAGLAALAAVVVAGVTISVFPQEPRTELPPVITVPVQPALFGPVPVSFLSGVIGKTTHAALIRGGAATRTSTSRDIGRVAVKISSMPPAEPAAPVKRTSTKRPTSIDGRTVPNGDAGLAASASTGMGEQSSAPCGACP